ncbi:dTDP-4-dehydrorhamnose 3,5-epimerase [Alicyclobacillus fastidiosus]|uniref:dTDP-4-dehydrorhamnose 3,5-epimerase n=1 Tax=Alicyclobacillus fastidiosus TaxID=392011 RepID=A0ABY6ZLU7_9BACL|nr:dTDP-4-dehydrorhamnose 3,5-epimerase [Alicyclobacillus fastidiosus]WAH43824.1 dTDP-4-dehydrorhamnose 3,5-epimerase [Alicyclobacillus fastidiosus]GMA60055.1 dTDP-4-dehydrorhamnose 3,5-epimerase [Alicyclobacillus fastidiosus]
MKIVEESLNGVKLLKPIVHRDSRGFFFESYQQSTFDQLGLSFNPVQENHSSSTLAGTIRGLHFQLDPFAQAKLVRVLRGLIYDVIVDIRSNSPTFGEWRGYHLSADNQYLLFVPKGFAHGFCTLVENTEVLYMVDSPYSPQHESGIIWSDPTLGITWPAGDKIFSEKDSLYPTFDEWMNNQH